VEDIEGVKRSYLKRDLLAIGLMTVTLVLAPIALWIVIKKVHGWRSLPEMKNTLHAA
jgi:hypothetical protein